MCVGFYLKNSVCHKKQFDSKAGIAKAEENLCKRKYDIFERVLLFASLYKARLSIRKCCIIDIVNLNIFLLKKNFWAMVGMIFLQRLVILRCNRMPGIFPLATTHRKTTIGRKDRLQPGLIYHGVTDCLHTRQ